MRFWSCTTSANKVVVAPCEAEQVWQPAAPRKVRLRRARVHQCAFTPLVLCFHAANEQVERDRPDGASACRALSPFEGLPPGSQEGVLDGIADGLSCTGIMAVAVGWVKSASCGNTGRRMITQPPYRFCGSERWPLTGVGDWLRTAEDGRSSAGPVVWAPRKLTRSPEVQISVPSARASASSMSTPRYRTVLSIFVWPSRICTARRLPVCL